MKFPESWIDGDKLSEWNQTANNFYRSNDFERATIYYQMAAENGHVESQFSLGVCYISGKGVPRDLFIGIFLYRMASLENHGKSLFNLGAIYEEGKIVNKDLLQAAMFYRLAQRCGISSAALPLQGLLKNPELKIQNLDDISPPSIENIQNLNKEGLEAMKKQNLEKGFQIFQQAAYSFFPESLYHLGMCYRTGKGTKVNERASYFCLKAAADLGYGTAALEIGSILESGSIVPKNLVQAKKYFEYAVNSKISYSKKALENVENYKNYKPGNENFKTIEIYRYAASRGDLHAMICLALCYENGAGMVFFKKSN